MRHEHTQCYDTMDKQQESNASPEYSAYKHSVNGFNGNLEHEHIITTYESDEENRRQKCVVDTKERRLMG